VQECRSSGVQEFRSSGGAGVQEVREFRSSGVQEVQEVQEESGRLQGVTRQLSLIVVDENQDTNAGIRPPILR